MTDNSGRYKQGDFVEAKPSKIPLFIILLVASIYVGTMSFHFRNIFQWESFHRHRQRHRHQSPTHFLKIDWKLEINFLKLYFIS